MKKHLYILYAVTLIAGVFLLQGTALGGSWVDDWLASSTSTSPGYFAGQQRGYYTGGTFSARWNGNGTVYPVTFTPPKIKAGCGGIDVFMGGFSFMNADYLVQKLQGILANAPAVAFDLALNTLCTPCSNAIKWMEDLSDKLNHLQLDSCKLSQITVAKAFEAAGDDNAKIKGLASRSYEMETGISSFYTDTQAKQDSNSGTKSESDDSLIAGCPADIKAIFGASGTVLDNIAKKINIDSKHMNFARGLFGDVSIYANMSNGVNEFNYNNIARCNQNSDNYGQLMDNFINNSIWQKDINDKCSLASTSALTTLVQDTLTSLVTNMSNKNPLSIAETDLLNRMPLPMHAIFKTAIVSGRAGSTVADLQTAVSKYYAYAMLRDILDQLIQTSNEANRIYQTQSTGSRADCQYDVIIGGVDRLNKLIPEFKKAMVGLDTAKEESLRELAITTDVALKFEEFQKRAQSNLSSMFLPSMVNRAIGR